MLALIDKNRFIVDLCLILFTFAIAVLLQVFAFGKDINIYSDVGIYHDAKLVAEGNIPYKDFFLAHPFYLVYLIAAILRFVNFDLNLFGFIYACYILSSIPFIYLIVFKLTQKRMAALLSVILFSTFPELITLNTSHFTLRAASLPLFTYSLFFLFVKSKPVISALFLSLFAISIVPNLLISALFIITWLLGEFKKARWDLPAVVKRYQLFLITFLFIIEVGYLLIFLIPRSFHNVFEFQLSRPFFPYQSRIEEIIYILPYNFALLMLGLIGSILFLQKMRFLGLFNLLTTLVTIFSGASFYSVYLLTLVPGYSISAGLLIASLLRYKCTSLVIILSLPLIFILPFLYPRYQLLNEITPLFFNTVEYLKTAPEPILTFEPLYGLYAKKDLTYHYHVSDSRYFKILRTNLTDQEYFDLLKRSNTVLIEMRAKQLMSLYIQEYIEANFQLGYQDRLHEVYIRPI